MMTSHTHAARRSALVVVGLLGLFFIGTVPSVLAGTITVGVDSGLGGNCAPIGCGANETTNPGAQITRYQQVYAASAFGAAIEISAITFYEISTHSAFNIDTAILTMSLSTTAASAELNTLSNNLPSNIGPDNQIFATVGLPTVVGATLSFVAATPFFYNPANGDLLLDIQYSNIVQNPNGDLTFFENDVSGVTARAIQSTAGQFPAETSHDRSGLVTTFTTVPEPGTVVLIGAGMAALCLLQKRKGHTGSRP